jgi:hypothetical protein
MFKKLSTIHKLFILATGIGIGYIVPKAVKALTKKGEIHLNNFRDAINGVFVPDATTTVQYRFNPYACGNAGDITISLRDRNRQLLGFPVTVNKVILTNNDVERFRRSNGVIELAIRDAISPENLRDRATARRHRNHHHR